MYFNLERKNMRISKKELSTLIQGANFNLSLGRYPFIADKAVLDLDEARQEIAKLKSRVKALREKIMATTLKPLTPPLS